MDLKERARQLKVDIPAVFLTLRHVRTPWYAKVVAVLAVCYALSPIDLIPDFIPVLGYLDDVIILPAMVLLVFKLVPGDVLDECREQARDLWVSGKPKRWFYAIPIILIWVAILGSAINSLFR